MTTSAHRVALRPPRPLVLGDHQKETGLIGHKPMSGAKADDAMQELIGLIANSPTPVQLDPKSAEILAKVLKGHGRH